jgi:hypothetical protein
VTDIGVPRSAPDGAMSGSEPLLAWRVWRLGIDPETDVVRPVLESCISGDAWPERKPFAASCPDHEVPDPDCGCGIYAVLTREAARRWAAWAQSALPNPVAVGRVQLWGRLLPDSAGYRAQLAYPYELAVLAGENLDVADARRLERLLQAAYLVDIAA